MKIVLQRVKRASCTVDGVITGKIEQGYLLLVGFTHSDTEEVLPKAAKKINNLRIFEDEFGKMNLNINAVNGSILSISQFTLYANTNEGNRPSFVNSMAPDSANNLYNKFNDVLRNDYGMVVETGIFGAHMILDPVCDGPVTIELEF